MECKKPKTYKKVNLHQQAVALKYGHSDIAPKVIAAGKGYIAQRILEKGLNNNVPIYQDTYLLAKLTKIDVGNHIPPELYEIVAQLLVFISDIDKREEILTYGKDK